MAKATPPADTSFLQDLNADYTEKYGFHDPEHPLYKAPKGLSQEIVEIISNMKDEPPWMREFRLTALGHFWNRPQPTWGSPFMAEVDYDNIHYFVRASEKVERDWDDVPADVKNTFERLGIPEAEQKFLSGVGAQYECLHGDTPVATSHGPVPIRDLQVGDTVYSWDQQTNKIVPSHVEALLPHDIKPLFELQAGNRRIVATDNHPFLVYGESGYEWKPLSELQAGATVATAGTHTPIIFQHIDTIRQVAADQTYDIQVADHHNFLAAGFIVHNSEVVYQQINEELSAQGVLFTDMDTALREHPELVRKYFATVIPANDNKLAALNSAVWSGGSFIYVPPGVHVEMPLQAYFRINTENMGQFERTLIIADEGSSVQYVEGCHLAGAQVQTDQGNVAIENISEGDLVLTHAGRYRPVTRTMTRQVQDPIHKITVEGLPHRPLYVTPGHPFLVGALPVSNHLHPDPTGYPPVAMWKDAQDTQVGEYLAIPRLIQQEDGSQAPNPAALAAADTNPLAVATDEYVWLPITDITRTLTITQVFNLSVADDESYLADGVISHNCTAPTYSSASLHAAVVELIALPGSRIRYTTIQNWSKTVYNLVTKRAVAYEDATVEWIDLNAGSRLTSKYPSVYLLGERAHGEVLSVAFAGPGQHQDAGAKIIHGAPNTTSNIFAKSISKGGGRTSYRGLLEVARGAHGSKSKVVCDALLLDSESRSDTYPTIRVGEPDVNIGHEATVSKIGEEQIFYLMSHGLTEEEAGKLIINGFIEPIVRELPMEYAVEMNRLMDLQMEGSIG